MADTWHGYLLLRRPAAIAVADWPAVLAAVCRTLDKRSSHPCPAHRLHTRLSFTGDECLIEAEFDRADLSEKALAPGPYTLDECGPGCYTTIAATAFFSLLSGARAPHEARAVCF